MDDGYSDVGRAWQRIDVLEAALNRIAWRLHLATGGTLHQDELATIYAHLDSALPFGPPE